MHTTQLERVIDSCEAMKHEHICLPTHCHLRDMRQFYQQMLVIPTSEVADCMLIRSHIAYHCGLGHAADVKIAPSRGHSYKVERLGRKTIVKITDYYDHRNGVIGYIN